jgi:hypothetical protein
MPIIAKRANSTFTPAPEGPQQAVCVDIVDLGVVEHEWKGKKKTDPMVRIVWHSAEINPETDQPYEISNRYTNSLGEKANLRKHLEAWRGRAFTEEELDGFDLETVIGVNAFISIVQNISKGKTYANIAAIMKLPKGMDPLPITHDYVRRCLRDDWEDPTSEALPDQGAPLPSDDDDSIPF